MNKLKLALFLFLGLAAYALYAKTTYVAVPQTGWYKDGKKWANHAFGFGMATGENEGIEFLDYQYGEQKTFPNGDPKLPFTMPSALEREHGKITQGSSINGAMPVGEYLYVKWRVLATGKEYEDRVDLRKLLPEDMEGKRLHFLVRDSQLIVYVITKHGHGSQGVECPIRLYKDFGCTRIYPDQWQNF